MITRIWSGKSRLYWLLLPLAWLYGLLSHLRRLVYQWGWCRSWRAPIPVIVVGNLTVGGNGKTPVVIWLVQQLQSQGYRVGVVSRGYGGKAAQYPLNVTSQTTTNEAGDEPVLIYQRTGAAIAVSPSRSDAVQVLLQAQSLDVIVTDDGLQHYALARDVEIVVVDGIRRFGNGWWLPAGPMRERAGRMKTVDAVINNGGVPHTGEIAMQLVGHSLVNLVSGERRTADSFHHAVAMAGIGHPQRFFTTLSQLGADVSQHVSFVDHQHYDISTLMALTENEQPLLMTEKDAVKCRHFARENWWYLPIDAVFSEGDAKALLDIVTATKVAKSVKNK